MTSCFVCLIGMLDFQWWVALEFVLRKKSGHFNESFQGLSILCEQCSRMVVGLWCCCASSITDIGVIILCIRFDYIL